MAYASNRSAQLAEGASGSHDLALLLLRVGLGLLILAHGVAKIGSGPGFVLDLVVKAGLPAAFGYLVYVGEVVAPILLIVGLWTRVAALVVAINMVVAILLVHTHATVHAFQDGRLRARIAIYLSLRGNRRCFAGRGPLQRGRHPGPLELIFAARRATCRQAITCREFRRRRGAKWLLSAAVLLPKHPAAASARI